MISGAHIVISTKDVEADRAFFRDVLGIACIDAGGGRLFFKLPPGEIDMHESERNDRHELYLQCDNVEATVARLIEAGVPCEPPVDRGWGILTALTLPGGGKIGLYQPRHPQP